MATLVGEAAPKIDEIYDLREAAFFPLIWEALLVLGRSENRMIEIVAPAPKDPGMLVRTVIDEAPMRYEMLSYSERILFLSIIISLITATLVYVSLHLLFVRPMLGITESMIAFPRQSGGRTAWRRAGVENGRDRTARRELARCSARCDRRCGQRSRLAALGTAVTKINHESPQHPGERAAGIGPYPRQSGSGVRKIRAGPCSARWTGRSSCAARPWPSRMTGNCRRPIRASSCGSW